MSFGFAIGDFVAVGELAFKLYRDCFKVAKGAPQEFQVLKGELSSLHNALKILEEEVKNPESVLIKAGEDRVRMVNELVSNVGVTLKKLEKVAAKFGILGDASKGRKIWVKFKWSVDFSAVDSLRNKLVYHNGMINLLLTSVGNSSLERIESSTRVLENDIGEIKDYIRASSKNEDNHSSTTPLISLVDDELLSVTLMKNAEILQPWNTIGADRWMKAGRWWLLKSQMELYATPEPDHVPVLAYTNLIKASWILIDIIACHPQRPFFDSPTRYEVQLLSAELIGEFKRINKLGLVVPFLHDISDQNLQIWETEARGPLLRPGKKSRGLDFAQAYSDSWAVEGEQIYFQRFALYRRQALTQSLPCMILFLVHETTNAARIVAQDQNGTALMEVAVQPQVDARTEGSSLTIDAENITFTTPKDAEYFCSVLEAAKLYFCFIRDYVNLDDFKAFIIMVSVKNKCQDAIMRLLENSTSKTSSSENSNLGSALDVASTLASQFIGRQLSDELREDSESDKSQISLFSWAVQCGHVAVVRLLLEKGADVEAKDQDGWMALHLAAQSGHKTVVQLLLEKGADIGAEDQDGRTALHLATWSGHEAVVRLLLKKGADVEANNNYGRTALHVAAQNGRKAVVRLLLRKGADVEAKVQGRWTALHLAADNGHETVVRLLLEKDADVEAKDQGGWTALHLAAQSGHKTVVQLLLEKDADVKAKIPNGQTALHPAAKNGHEAVVRLLLEKDANIKAEDQDGRTALHLAAKNGHEAVVGLLLEKGADGEAKIQDRLTALHLAAQSGREAVVQLLFEKGADVETKCQYGLTALHLAAHSGHEAMVRLLFEKGADVEAKDQYGWTALHEAAGSGHEVVLQLLLEKGANVEAKGRDGVTALHLAAQRGREAVVQLLFEKGANVETKCQQGLTALHLAAQSGHEAMVRLLLEKGTDVEAKDQYGRTALHAATRSGYEAVMRLLESRIKQD